MPALPLDEAGKYVAAAYVVFVALILVYVAIMAAKLERIQRELGELADLAEEKFARASDGVAHPASPDDRSPSAPYAAEPAAPLAPKPAASEQARMTGRPSGALVDEGEASGGGVLDV